MPRYIDADEALRMMRNSKQDNPYAPPKKGVWEIAHDCCISCVDAVTTEDVVEVKHGEWTIDVLPLTMCKKVYCSVCGYFETKGPAWEENWGLHNFCPNCGAKMNEKGD